MRRRRDWCLQVVPALAVASHPRHSTRRSHPRDGAPSDGLASFTDEKRHPDRDPVGVDLVPALLIESDQCPDGRSRLDHLAVRNVGEELEAVEVVPVVVELSAEAAEDAVAATAFFGGQIPDLGFDLVAGVCHGGFPGGRWRVHVRLRGDGEFENSRLGCSAQT